MEAWDRGGPSPDELRPQFSTHDWRYAALDWARLLMEVRELTLHAPVDALEVALSRRRKIEVQLTGPGARVLSAGLLDELKIDLYRQTPPPRPVRGVAPPGEILRDFYQSTGSGVADSSHQVLWFHRPKAGPYRIVVRIGSSTIGSTEFAVRDDAKDGERLAISLSDGRLVQARLVMPAKIPAEVAKRFLAITAIVRSDPSINPLAIAPDELLEREGELIPIWLPEPFDAIRVGSREVRLLPLRTSTHGVGRDLHLSLRPDLISESTTLEVRVVGSNGSQVQGRWPIYVLPISGDGAPQIVAMLTDCAGRLTLPLGVGMYELRTDKSFIVPFSKVQISMAAEENISVAVQIGP